MIINYKIYFFLACSFVVTISFFHLNSIVPFSGDEFYTLDIKNIHKPIPYKLIISMVISLLDPITPKDVLLLRLTSLFFILCSFLLWFYCYLKSKNEALIFSLLMISGAFVIGQGIFFRYYSYYFLSSSIIFFCLAYYTNRLTINQKLAFGIVGTALSPYMFFILNALQFIFFTFYIFLFEKIKNTKIQIALIIVIISGLFLIIIYPKLVWYLFNWLNTMEHSNINMSSENIRGFSIGIFIKPFYSIFQMIFGYHLTPTDSVPVMVLFILISVSLLYIFYLSFLQERELAMIYFVIAILPFFSIYYFFEVVSLPGFTQLESKHGLLLYPIVIALFIKTSNYLSPNKSKVIISIVLIGQLMGMHTLYKADEIDWPYIVNEVHNYFSKSEQINIIVDGRSVKPYNFFNEHTKEVEKIHIWESLDSTRSWSKDKERLAILLNDYKSYTPLSIEQNWNAGFDSQTKANNLYKLLDYLNTDYYLIESYVNYPAYLYLLEKKQKKSNIYSFDVWQHNLKDLRLPIDPPSSRNLISSSLIAPNDELEIMSDSIIVLNIENSIDINQNDTLGLIINGQLKIPLIKGVNIWDLFADYFNENVRHDMIFHEWNHKPLISGSISYPGSYFHHNARIYFLRLDEIKSETLVLKNTSKNAEIRIWFHNMNNYE
tara:strand:+ start:18013 stop:19992 length:1980 start_codon:yes stop_codon:yes gene_type:complete